MYCNRLHVIVHRHKMFLGILWILKAGLLTCTMITAVNIYQFLISNK